MGFGTLIILIVAGLLLLVGTHDLLQKRHAILRNFPIIGHLRYLLEKLGPELRQYIVADNDEERPFNRDQRRWVYATAKKENPYFGFGTDNDVDLPGKVVIKHSAFPAQNNSTEPFLPSAKVLGAWGNRQKAFRPNSIVNISGMSFGSLSGRAIEALNKGSILAGCLHNTGEGGISTHHRHGGELVYQIGTGLFGSRDSEGNFSMNALQATIKESPVKAIEIKLSQGAKPGIGGVLPAKKVTAEIANTRGVPKGVMVKSPPKHTSFSDVEGLINFVEMIATETGLPVGIKAAVGQIDFWVDLANQMHVTRRGPDFISIDGAEGGTGAAPLVFSDSVAYPFRIGFAKVYDIFYRQGLHREITFIGAGKLGYPDTALAAFALGCDMVNVGREAMLAIGCIQAQRCHTGQCPTGVATQSPWLARGLNPNDKSVRAANYVMGLRQEIQRLCQAVGVGHPSLVPESAVEIIDSIGSTVSILEHYGLSSSQKRLEEHDINFLNTL
ncbi:MAG: FMN-binding glutamate synthase family protein [Acidimicrobiales bacterium]|nr:FMN-binding glutamate synthase family protein [Acidimicrobiales bacterium]